ncbi:hypothetical protein XYCOK13_04430 [Xylanibacillus composti]|uniref:SLH domain-containing protein n=2 Tax=Xylanibacillus composti TaxID=1572762 RepID=A0A8J4GYR8_9BACL|nr:S-layer homology domain-containing protein [Xylanibacillus composti]GIQ67619.1 hypothetical protein XYCOK13_04430 [Xylanibacillus composti]
MKVWRKASLLCIITAMIFTILPFSAFAADSETTVNMKFSDVRSGHWAEQHVAKLALQDVITGRPGGKFAPDDSVTKEEVVIMLIGFLGLKEEAERSQRDSVLPLSYSPWAKPYINKAVEEGLLRYQEELNLQDSDDLTSSVWGQEQASREWVAKMLIRAIGKEEDAEQMDTQVDSFPDASDVSAWAYPYMNAAVGLGILTGSGGKLLPQDTVTRAQIAVMLSKADEVSDYLSENFKQVHIGSVVSVSSDLLQIQDSNGEAVRVALSSDAMLYKKGETSPIGLNGIQPFYQVYLIEKNGIGYYVEVLEEMTFQKVTGRFVLTSTNPLQVIVEVNGSGETYELDPDVAVVKANGSGSSIRQIVANSTVELYYNADINDGKIQRIVIVQEPVNKTATGIVQRNENGQLTIVEAESTDEESFEVSDSVLVTYDKRLMSLDDLKQGDEISYDVKDSIITAIRLIKPSVPLLSYDSGTIRAIEKDFIVYEKNEDDPIVRYVSPNLTVLLEGADNPSLNDLHPGDRVDLEINGENRITKISVKNREVTSLVRKRIVSVQKTGDYYYLTVEMGRNDLELYRIDEHTVVRYNQTNVNMNNFEEYFTKDRYVNLTFSNNQLLRLEGVSVYSGEVHHVDVDEKKFEIKTERYGVVEFTLTNLSRVERNGSFSVGFLGLNPGMPVKVYVDMTQQNVDRVLVLDVLRVDVLETNANNNRLSVRMVDGTTRNVYLSQSTPIKLLNQSNGFFSSIQAGQPVFLVYEGTTVTEVRLAETILGEVKAVRADGMIEVRQFNGENRTLRKTDDRSVKAGDRVAITVDGYENQSIVLLNSITRQYWKNSSVSQTVSVRITQLNEQSDYPLANNVYVHDEDGKEITLNSLKSNEMITLYLYDGKVVEVVKRK